ncbi:hypothetical protein [Nonomuraea roseoviolacea]|uniref:Uncharacterized protein n=1 Tax=Nonomuraea roseoviolacea subsp. carminata TaxID=160689 RepID=A0ABT1KAJ8_9ACTN|nr:hypothetical protein [Nonomuraea roseoviolacea]MCP2350634.1 hypothetical protein [Nonomuraea roseoviolacea subsp. carminata]
MSISAGGTAWNTLTTAGTDGSNPGKLYWKIAGGSEPASYTFNQDSGADAAATMIAIQDASTNTPVVATSTGGTGTSIQTPSTTPAGTTDLDVRFVSASGGMGTSESLTPPGTYTEFADISSRQFVYVSGAYKTLASGAATGVQSFTITTSPTLRRGVTVTVTSGSTVKDLTDTGTVADDVTVAAAATLADTGSASETLDVAADTILTESVAAVDDLMVGVTVALAETIIGADDVGGGVPVDLADTATGVDDLTTLVSPVLDDSIAGIDALTVAADAGLDDSVSAADALSAAEVLQTSLSEAVLATDGLAVLVLQDITVVPGTPRRGWGSRQPERSWLAGDPARGWSARPPTT